MESNSACYVFSKLTIINHMLKSCEQIREGSKNMTILLEDVEQITLLKTWYSCIATIMFLEKALFYLCARYMFLSLLLLHMYIYICQCSNLIGNFPKMEYTFLIFKLAKRRVPIYKAKHFSMSLHAF
jgi:hypothetical protein